MFGLSHKQLYLLCAAALVAMVVGFELVERRQEAADGGPQPHQLHSKLPDIYSGPRESERAREIFASKRECEDRARNLRAKMDMGVYEWSCKKV
jgi:hypothetical protein